MTPEIIATFVAAAGLVVALGGLIVSLFLWLRADMHHMRNELKSDIKALDAKVANLSERVARVEGKLEFLEHYITRQNEPPPAPAE